ncbi:MAG: DUF4942 domain-containing protein [Mameliella sp.]|nr:DUF4942 domain-containing protein [Mameliella sp.]
MKSSISDVLAEYEQKCAEIPALVKEYSDFHTQVDMRATVAGTYAGSLYDRGTPSLTERGVAENLLKSAWRHVYSGLNIGAVASAKDRKKFELMLENPPEFTRENIRDTFGDYFLQPRFHILRGLAEAFVDLDPAYKSHSKIKVGVAGLPKRIIISNVGDYGSYGRDQLRDVVNAILTYQGEPHMGHSELETFLTYDPGKAGQAKDWQPDTRYAPGALVKHDGKVWRANGTIYPRPEFERQTDSRFKDWVLYENPLPGLSLKRFKNGNAHLIFSSDMLRTINKALAEFYGEVLADVTEKGEVEPKTTGTAVSKDLQFYPTPRGVIEHILGRELDLKNGAKVLEPSCGTGEIMEALLAIGSDINLIGIEYHAARAAQAKAKGLRVARGNFFNFPPDPSYDLVVMNPPFYGTHWKKHLAHAIKFLKPHPEGQRWGGGRLICILPATAFYDGHLGDMGLVPKDAHTKEYGWRDTGWNDLPVASFAESGTNVPTGYFTMSYRA